METKRINEITSGEQAEGLRLSPEELWFWGEVGEDKQEKETEQHMENGKKFNRAWGYLTPKNIWNRQRMSGLISLVKNKIENRPKWNSLNYEYWFFKYSMLHLKVSTWSLQKIGNLRNSFVQEIVEEYKYLLGKCV